MAFRMVDWMKVVVRGETIFLSFSPFFFFLCFFRGLFGVVVCGLL